MSACQLSAYPSVLRPLAFWCLDTFGEGPPMLIGVTMGPEQVSFHPVELFEDDPVGDLFGLVAPEEWDAVVFVAAAELVGPTYRGATIAHAVDQTGGSASALDEWCGRRRELRLERGRLHQACTAMFVASNL